MVTIYAQLNNIILGGLLMHLQGPRLLSPVEKSLDKRVYDISKVFSFCTYRQQMYHLIFSVSKLVNILDYLKRYVKVFWTFYGYYFGSKEE